MQKGLVHLSYTLVFEITEDVEEFDSLTAAVESGMVKVIVNNVSVSNGEGEVYDNKEELDEVKQAFWETLKGLG